MNILFKDKKDITDDFKKQFKGSYFISSKEKPSKEMLECEILSVSFSKVDVKLIKSMPNLKWIVNRSYNTDHINVNHCDKNNIGIVNINYTLNCVANYIEDTINENYYLPYYLVIGNEKLSNKLNKCFKYTKFVDIKNLTKLYDYVNESNTIIIDLQNKKENKEIINKEIFDKLKQNTNLINISNGKVINNKDLIEAIKSGKINHSTLNSINNDHKKELLDLIEDVKYTKEKAKSYNIDNIKYGKLLKRYITSIENNKPAGVILERFEREVDTFWD